MIWRKLPSSRDAQIDAMSAHLSKDLAMRVPEAQDLESRLESLAKAVAALEGLAGAMVVVYDEDGYPLRYSGANLSVRDEALPYTALEEIQAYLRGPDTWDDVPAEWIDAAGAKSISGRRIEGDGRLLGMILVTLNGSSAASVACAGIERAIDHLRWVIRDALRLERLRCIEAVRAIESEELGRSRQIQPQTIAKRVKQIFAAEAVTILVREQGKLYLSATTDAETGEDLGEYRPGVGISGFIFTTGIPVRLYDAMDPEAIRRVGANPKKASAFQYPEQLAKSGKPFRLLAVPMRSGWKDVSDGPDKGNAKSTVRGVIRILRKERRSAFTAYEQEALQHFADLLAVAMYASWRLLLADSVMHADTEALCIFRNEPGAGHSHPLVYSEEGAEAIFGLSKEELRGIDARKLYPPGEYEKIRDLLDKAIAKGYKSCGREKTKGIRFNSPGDDIRSLDISYRLVESPFVKPATHYTIAVIRDITTAQLEADQHKRLVNLLDQKGLAYYQADENGLTIQSSATERALTGYSFAELIRKPRQHLYVNPDDRTKLISKVSRRKDGQLVHTTQYLRRKDGTTLLTEGVIHLLKDNQGNRLGYEGFYEDITDRVRLQGFLDADTETILREHDLYRKLEENARFQLLFMTSLSHQLRSPLGALVQQLLNFQEGVISASRFSKRLAYAIGQAKVSALLVANLTYMDKILRGESFKREPVSMASLALETKLNFEHLLPEKRLKIFIDDTSLTKNLDVLGHKELLRQIFVNLIDNAIKYSMPGSYIRVSGRYDQNGRYLQVSSRGIALPDNRGEVFQRGFRTRQAEALIPAGTGLGLWLVRKIATAHGATVRCASLLEEGRERTAFQVFFPDDAMRQGVERQRRT